MTTDITTIAAPFAYTESAWPIPPRIRDAHIRSWERLAAPGEWWSGAERVSIAVETRRAAALLDGQAHHVADRDAGLADLPEAAIFAIHKLIGDLPNVSREWYQELIDAEGMSDARYIELLGVLVHVWSVDEFHRALSLPLEPLPAPLAGEPTAHRPVGLADHGSWPPTLAAADLAPSESDIYEGMPRAANVLAAMSLHPDSVRWLNDLFEAHYLSWQDMSDYQTQARALSRPQLELMASRVSALNECFY